MDNQETKPENGRACGLSTAPCYGISDQINDARHSFIVRYSQNPERLYLGMSEFGKLRAFVEAFLSVKLTLQTKTPPKFSGMKIYIVNRENHLSVA